MLAAQTGIESEPDMAEQVGLKADIFPPTLEPGTVMGTVTQDASKETEAINALSSLGINIDSECQKLLEAGVLSFDKAFEELLESIEKKAEQLIPTN